MNISSSWMASGWAFYGLWVLIQWLQKAERDQGFTPGSNLKTEVWRAAPFHGVEVLKPGVSRNASSIQPSYNSRCLHVTLQLNKTTVQGDTTSQEGGTASSFHHPPCFAPISFLASYRQQPEEFILWLKYAQLLLLGRTEQLSLTSALKPIKQQTLRTQHYW